jgi:hypothetical protein
MAEVISQKAYEAILKIPEDQRSQKMVDAVNDFLNAKYNIPTKKDSRKAVAIINAVSKYPNTHSFSQEQIDWAKSIRQQEREGRALMNQNEQNGGYIRDVKRVPDDINKDYGFKFNWKSAYENETGEKLRPNEADAKKLEQYISNKVSDYEKGEDLRKTANDMKMYSNKVLNSWSKFVQGDSNNSKEFQNYLKDMQKIQKDKRLNEIWNKESNMAVDFMLPVSKEYARKNYENINGVGDMALPLATDAASNAAMLLGGESKAATLAGNIASPIISNAGQYAFNDMPLGEAAAGGLLGAATNVATPRVVGRMANQADALAHGKVGNLVQTRINEAATRASKIQRKIDEGVPFQLTENTFLSKGKGKKPDIIYTNNPNAKFGTINFGKDAKKDVVVKPLSDLNEAVAGPMDEGLDAFPKWAMRKNLLDNNTRWNDIIRDIETRNNPKLKQELENKLTSALKTQNTNEIVRTLDKMTAGELMLLGKANKETKANFIKRKIDEYAGLTKNYGMNMLGRDKYANPILRNVDNIFGTDLTSPDKKPDTNKLIKLYGLDQD